MPDKRFRKPFSPPYSAYSNSLRPTPAKDFSKLELWLLQLIYELLNQLAGR
jgi:hypothetical protein